MKHTVRTFAAVELTPAIRAAAIDLIETLRDAPADAKWVEEHNLHVTLKFLGDVRAAEIARVCSAVQKGVSGVDPFDLEIRGAGAFPNAGRPRTVWLGAGEGEDEMVALHDAVEAPLAKLGFRREHRRFHPHVTLGRVRRGGPGLAELGRRLVDSAEFSAGVVRVTEVVVFSSELTRTGPVYEVLGRGRLGQK